MSKDQRPTLLALKAALSATFGPAAEQQQAERPVSNGSKQESLQVSPDPVLSGAHLDSELQDLAPEKMSSRRYAPLRKPDKDIRLVVLHPASVDYQEIKCDLEVINVANAKYEALSYAWGDETVSTSILLNGRPFLVTRNLEQALRSLRTVGSDQKQTRKLWIDAICIDQQNYVERSQQVKRMGSIYKSAIRVLVWLGNYYEKEDDSVPFDKSIWGFPRMCQGHGNWESTKEAFKLAEVLFEQSRAVANSKKKSKGSGRTPTLNLHTWGFLSILCQRAWFHRLWVIQEIQMARKAVVCCGRAQLSWRKLKGATDRVATYFESPNEWPFPGRHPSIDEMTAFSGNISIVGLWDVDRSNILSILVHTQYSESSDPRDRLFALRGLLTKDDTDIEVNYSEEPEIVFRNWTLSRIKRTRSLDVLTICTDYDDDLNKRKIPSWVPDLRNLSLVDDTFFALSNDVAHDQEQSYAASKGMEFRLKDIDEHDIQLLVKAGFERDWILPVQGCYIGTITKRISVESNFGPNFSFYNCPQACIFLEEQIMSHFKTSRKSTKPIDPVWHYEPFLNSLFRGWKWYAGADSEPTLAARYAAWRDPAKTSEAQVPFLPPNFAMILRIMLRTADIFITDKGPIGSVSKHCEAGVGDKIYVLLGSNAPVILKSVKSQDVKPLFELRSVCFLDGYMQGEAIESWEKGMLELETLYLV